MYKADLPLKANNSYKTHAAMEEVWTIREHHNEQLNYFKVCQSQQNG